MTGPRTKLRILVLGYLVRGPLGGLAWHYIQYVLGLADLGHDVWYIEDGGDEPLCYDPHRHVTDADPAYGLGFAERVFDRLALGDRWAYHDGRLDRWHGPAADRIVDLCSTADIVINISAVNPMRPWMMEIPIRVFVDTDPAFEQIRQLTNPERRRHAARHTHFVSFGENIATGIADLPRDGIPWQSTRQPIVLDAWPVSPGPKDGAFTTVMQWDSYPPREYDGVRYDQKSVSFEPFLDLPSETGPILELALGSSSAPRDVLRNHGWRLRDPLEITRDPWTYQDYILGSMGEFGVAKHGYVRGNTGWFSERTAAYLASGRPAVIQDSGFTEWLDSSDGCHPFTTLEEAAAGIETVLRDYEHECAAARALAEEFFDSRKVLSRLLDLVTEEASRPTGVPSISSAPPHDTTAS